MFVALGLMNAFRCPQNGGNFGAQMLSVQTPKLTVTKGHQTMSQLRTDGSDGGAAFAQSQNTTDYDSGMSLRDYIASHALQGMLSGYWGNSDLGGLSPKSLADEAYQYADAMIAAREK
jgi:hypothetical protein